jgi:deleted-in-malignant-brain-tumors protein 1
MRFNTVSKILFLLSTAPLCSSQWVQQQDDSGASAESRAEGLAARAPAEGDVRLAGGTGNNNGRVEIYHNGEWGTVCDDFFSVRDAKVVCRQLGFSTNSKLSHFLEPEANRSEIKPDPLSSFRLGTRIDTNVAGGSGTIWLDNVACTGNEAKLIDCRSNTLGVHNCDHSEDIGIACQPVNEGDIRLVGGSTVRSGRVEIYHAGAWGTVCDDSFGVRDASVVCRQLGFATNGKWSGYLTKIILQDKD